MLIRVVDLETSSFNPDDGVCEAAFTQIEDVAGRWQITADYTTLLHPAKPISRQAEEVHGISNDMVINAIPDRHLNKLVVWEVDSEPYAQVPVDFVVAHNYSFEKKFITVDSAQWICTLACAKKIYPGLRNYKNGDVFNHVKGRHDYAPERCEPAHRALPDTYVTAIILLDMLANYTPHDLANMTAGRAVGSSMTYGKYKGIRIDDEKLVPSHYLRWIYNESNMHQGHKADARDELQRRGVPLIDLNDKGIR